MYERMSGGAEGHASRRPPDRSILWVFWTEPGEAKRR
jgi:hypothetical protein